MLSPNPLLHRAAFNGAAQPVRLHHEIAWHPGRIPPVRSRARLTAVRVHRRLHKTGHRPEISAYLAIRISPFGCSTTHILGLRPRSCYSASSSPVDTWTKDSSLVLF